MDRYRPKETSFVRALYRTAREASDAHERACETCAAARVAGNPWNQCAEGGRLTGEAMNLLREADEEERANPPAYGWPEKDL